MLTRMSHIQNQQEIYSKIPPKLFWTEKED